MSKTDLLLYASMFLGIIFMIPLVGIYLLTMLRLLEGVYKMMWGDK